MIFRSSDFLGINHYTARIIGNKVKSPSEVSVVADRDTVASVDEKWPTYVSIFSQFIFLLQIFVFKLLKKIKNDKMIEMECIYINIAFIRSGSSWLRPVPKGFRRLLNWIKKEYGSVPLYVTENGFSDRAGNLDDMGRIYYYKHYINQVLKGI